MSDTHDEDTLGDVPMTDSELAETSNDSSGLQPGEAVGGLHVTAEDDLVSTLDPITNTDRATSASPPNKTTDSLDSDSVDSEQSKLNKASRELKSILALSKEAKLDTNISHKRKSLDPGKGKVESPSNKLFMTVDSSEATSAKKTKLVVGKFPVTAESELDELSKDSEKPEKPENASETEKTRKRKDSAVSSEEAMTGGATVLKDRKGLPNSPEMFQQEKNIDNKDIFCWRCHREDVNISCETCPRSYHKKCLKQNITDGENWPCPECVAILKAESTQTRSEAMKGMTLEHLCGLLKFAVKRMIECNGSEPFLHDVNIKDFPDYKRYIIQPMSLTQLEKNIKGNHYGSTQAFEADAKWILHNSIIFNSYQSKLTSSAKIIMKICKQEMLEVENCPSCYLNANTKKKTWFVEVCPKPHLLVWAKLKGFPYWPAKVMCTNSQALVDVRFFGAHDRAWVPVKECFLYSIKDPNSNKQKRHDIIECMKEVEVYISNLKAIYGEFNYAPFKIQFDPENEDKQLCLFLPGYKNASSPKSIKNMDKKATLSIEKKTNGSDANTSIKEDDIPEGYGTDDESMHELSEAHKKLRLSTTLDESITESEISKLENDEEVSTKRPRSSFSSLVGKIKIIPKKNDSTPSKKPPPNEEPQKDKTSRRNSDQSVKSDKIEPVDVKDSKEIVNSENSDLNQSDNVKKPSQVIVENTEVSLSPTSKLKISDKLIKRLSNENKQPDGGLEPDKDKTQTDVLLEQFTTKKDTEDKKMEICEEEKAPITDKETPTKNNINEAENVPKIDEKPSEEPNNQKEPIEENTEKSDMDVDEKSTLENNDISMIAQEKTKEKIEPQVEKSPIDNLIQTTLPSATKETPPVTKLPIRELIEEEQPKVTVKTQQSVLKTNTESKKRKLDDVDLPINNKMIKIVPIQSILNKKYDKEEITLTKVSKKVVQNARKIDRTPVSSPKTNKDMVMEIKSEPESDSEITETEYMEQKRKYLSALNISEKQDAKPKKNEIRTRSKTEDKSKKAADLGEIYVKSFAKIPPAANKKPAAQVVKKYASPQSKVVSITQRRDSPQNAKPVNSQKDTTTSTNTKTTPTPPTTTPTPPTTSITTPPQLINSKTLEPINASHGGLVILTSGNQHNMMGNLILPQNQQMGYNPPTSFVTFLNTPSVSTAGAQQVLNAMVTSQQVAPAQGPPQMLKDKDGNKVPNPSVKNTQNYIPQGENDETGSVASENDLPTLVPINDNTPSVPPPTAELVSKPTEDNDEFSVLNNLLPDNVSKAMYDLLNRPPPKLKPRPPGPLSANFDPGTPSSAGPISSRINSISHRLGDYFRGMLVETLEDLGKSNNSEATIAALKLEIENLKHKHSVEVMEVRKNVTTLLKDIQKSVAEDKDRIIDETRAACEIETIKRIDEAKAKQWCANCTKEAQFYCCWNTSYCDYPCQQRHWAKHMTKCTQHSTQPQPVAQNSVLLRPTLPPKGFNRIIAKPTKVYLNRGNTNSKPVSFKPGAIIVNSAGNLELVGNGSLSGKLTDSTSVVGKLKAGNAVTVTSPSTNSNISITKATPSVYGKPLSSSSIHIVDDDADSSD